MEQYDYLTDDGGWFIKDEAAYISPDGWKKFQEQCNESERKWQENMDMRVLSVGFDQSPAARWKEEYGIDRKLNGSNIRFQW